MGKSPALWVRDSDGLRAVIESERAAHNDALPSYKKPLVLSEFVRLLIIEGIDRRKAERDE